MAAGWAQFDDLLKKHAPGTVERFDDPYEALGALPVRLFFDTLKILKADGLEARVLFPKDH